MLCPKFTPHFTYIDGPKGKLFIYKYKFLCRKVFKCFLRWWANQNDSLPPPKKRKEKRKLNLGGIPIQVIETNIWKNFFEFFLYDRPWTITKTI
jgi:hypothetical protein